MTAQQLKNSILQMAVQGKLVSQDPTDEPASVLLERIRAEKERLIKEGKIKKEKNPSVIFRGSDNLPYEKVGKNEINIQEELPFDIPKNWCWTTIEYLSYNVGNKENQILTQEIKKDGVLPVVSQGQDLIDGFCNDQHKMISDIPVVMFGDHTRNVKYIDFNFVIGADGTKFHKIIIAEVKYIYYWMQYAANQLCDRGYARHYTLLKKFFLPLPPLAEQKRIVAKIKELLPHIEEYGKAESKVSKLNAEFPEKLKKSILQWAIQGKLVPQNPDDEPASVLLERIRAEKAKLIKEGKIKKDKNESIIFRRDNSHYEKLNGVERCIDDEIPFEIPDSWEWVRLRNIFNVVSARRVHQADWRSSGIPFYRAREIALLAENGYVENELFIDEKLFQTFAKDGIPSVGDLMITAVGTLGKCYIVKEKDHFYYKDASVICFENFARISAEYIQNLLNSPYMVETIKSASTGTTVGTITMVKANEYLIPLPPLAEQQRIVEAIESVLKKLTI